MWFFPSPLAPFHGQRLFRKLCSSSSSLLYVLFCHRTRVGPPDAGVEWSGGDLTSFPKKKFCHRHYFFLWEGKEGGFCQFDFHAVAIGKEHVR